MIQLREQFGCENIALGYLEGRPCVEKFSKDIRKQVGDRVDPAWEEEMQESFSTLTKQELQRDKRLE